jgi:uncharacterized protein
MLDLLVPFIAGFAGSLHCLGMCGPVVLGYSLQLNTLPAVSFAASGRQGVLSHHLAFQAGRIGVYGLFGALSGGIIGLAGLQGILPNVRVGVTLLAGTLMVLLGLGLLHVLPLSRSLSSPGKGTSFFGRLFSALITSKRLSSRVALGAACGFLPCMLSWAMVVKAAATGTLLSGFSTMTLFGLGTCPALLFTGLLASHVSLALRIAGQRVAALSVISMGVLLLIKAARHL